MIGEQSIFRQQVNLLPRESTSPIDWLSLSRMISYLVVLIVALCCTTFLNIWTNRQVGLEFKEATMRKDNANLAVTQFVKDRDTSSSYDINVYDPKKVSLGEQISRVQDELQLKQRIIDYLDRNALGYSLGYSSLFEGLVRGQVRGMSLQTIYISGGADNIVLRGKVNDPTSLPAYLEKLKTEEVFRNRRFDTLVLQRKIASSESLTFVLATRDE